MSDEQRNEYAIDLSALDVKADKLVKRLRRIDQRISHFATRYERLLIAKNEAEVDSALRGICCDMCQREIDEDGELDW